MATEGSSSGKTPKKTRITDIASESLKSSSSQDAGLIVNDAISKINSNIEEIFEEFSNFLEKDFTKNFFKKFDVAIANFNKKEDKEIKSYIDKSFNVYETKRKDELKKLNDKIIKIDEKLKSITNDLKGKKGNTFSIGSSETLTSVQDIVFEVNEKLTSIQFSMRENKEELKSFIDAKLNLKTNKENKSETTTYSSLDNNLLREYTTTLDLLIEKIEQIDERYENDKDKERAEIAREKSEESSNPKSLKNEIDRLNSNIESFGGRIGTGKRNLGGLSVGENFGYGKGKLGGILSSAETVGLVSLSGIILKKVWDSSEGKEIREKVSDLITDKLQLSLREHNLPSSADEVKEFAKGRLSEFGKTTLKNIPNWGESVRGAGKQMAEGIAPESSKLITSGSMAMFSRLFSKVSWLGKVPGLKMFSKIAKPLSILMAAGDAFEGYTNASEILDKTEPSELERWQAGAGNAISGLSAIIGKPIISQRASTGLVQSATGFAMGAGKIISRGASAAYSTGKGIYSFFDEDIKRSKRLKKEAIETGTEFSPEKKKERENREVFIEMFRDIISGKEDPKVILQHDDWKREFEGTYKNPKNIDNALKHFVSNYLLPRLEAESKIELDERKRVRIEEARKENERINEQTWKGITLGGKKISAEISKRATDWVFRGVQIGTKRPPASFTSPDVTRVPGLNKSYFKKDTLLEEAKKGDKKAIELFIQKYPNDYVKWAKKEIEDAIYNKRAVQILTAANKDEMLDFTFFKMFNPLSHNQYLDDKDYDFQREFRKQYFNAIRGKSFTEPEREKIAGNILRSMRGMPNITKKRLESATVTKSSTINEDIKNIFASLSSIHTVLQEIKERENRIINIKQTNSKIVARTQPIDPKTR